LIHKQLCGEARCCLATLIFVSAELYSDVNGAILLHICGALPALLIGPLQFWSKFRNRFLHIHRWCGRIYLIGVAVAAVGALYIAIFATNSLVARSGLAARTGLGTLAVFWLLSAGIAYRSIRRGHIRDHKEWMIRSYIMTFVFVSHRLLTGWMIGLGFDFPEAFAAMSWMCWVPALMFTEIIFFFKRQHNKVSSTANKAPIRTSAKNAN
jgi:uncharacterized membrane protein